MKKITLETLPKDTLIELLKMYSRNWQSLDGLWFGNVESECGLDTAIKVDIQNWQKQAVLEAKRIKKILKLGRGLEPILTALSMMSWQLTSPLFEIESESTTEIVFYYVQCAVQESRALNQKPLFPCKTMKNILLSSIAGVIEPRAEITCLHAPPDPYQSEKWCKWKLTLRH